MHLGAFLTFTFEKQVQISRRIASHQVAPLFQTAMKNSSFFKKIVLFTLERERECVCNRERVP